MLDIIKPSMLDSASNEYPIGSMVLLYMVTWIPSTEKTVMLALIYQHHGSVMGTITPMFGVEVGSPASNALPEHFMGAETPIDDAGAPGDALGASVVTPFLPSKESEKQRDACG